MPVDYAEAVAVEAVGVPPPLRSRTSHPVLAQLDDRVVPLAALDTMEEAELVAATLRARLGAPEI